MSYFLFGAMLALGVLIVSIMWSYYTHTGTRNETTIWKIIVDAFNLPTKLIIAGPTYFLLIATIALSYAVADGLHDRMERAGWDDIPWIVNICIQMLGTVAFYLIPVMVALVLDKSLPRPGWSAPNVNSSDAAIASKAKKYVKEASTVQKSVAGIGIASVVLVIVLGYLDIVNVALSVSSAFFFICLTAAILVSVTGYYYSGSSHVEIMVLMLATIVGIGVYSLDFYWNRQLTVDFTLNNLDFANLTDLEISKEMQKAHQDFANRTMLNIVLIIVDLFAAAWSLLSNEHIWFLRMQKQLAAANITAATAAATTRFNPKGPVNTSTAGGGSVTPPPPNPPTGGSGATI
jgi:hypothetical protein